MARRYTKEMIDYVREITPGRYTPEITEMFNDKFDMDLTVGQMKSLKSNRKIWSGVSVKNPYPRTNRLFSEEQICFIKAHVEGTTNKDLTDLINQQFGLALTCQQVKGWKKNNNMSSGLTGHFEKGRVPINKGTKGMFNVGGNKTSFKKGHVPKNHQPVGYERMDIYGYIVVKVQEKGTYQERWKHKHRLVWEEANGPIPKGMRIIFIDRDGTNLDLDNMMLVTDQQHLQLIRNNWRFDDPELLKLGLQLADVKIAIGSATKKIKKTDSAGKHRVDQ